MPRKEPTRFGLMRHARTLWNEERRIQGHADSPLSEAGRVQCRDWGPALARFRFDRILASDLGRARATAEAVNEALGLPLDLDPGLREQDWGRWTGLTLEEIRATEPEVLAAALALGWGFRPPGGEDRSEVLERAAEALDRAALARPGHHILVVCHEGVLKCLVYALLGRSFDPEAKPLIRGYRLHFLEWADGLRLAETGAPILPETDGV